MAVLLVLAAGDVERVYHVTPSMVAPPPPSGRLEATLNSHGNPFAVTDIYYSRQLFSILLARPLVQAAAA